jgi:hypothetical protein
VLDWRARGDQWGDGVLDQGGGRQVSGWQPYSVKVVAGEWVVAMLGHGGSGRPCWG